MGREGVKRKGGGASVDEFVRRVAGDKAAGSDFDYRRASLALHGTVCARCGRDFSGRTLRLLTVHHKDGNHQNNPRDGSNWENLCVYCHEDAHCRSLVADEMREADFDNQTVTVSPAAGRKSPLAEKLAAALGGRGGGGDGTGMTEGEE